MRDYRFFLTNIFTYKDRICYSHFITGKQRSEKSVLSYILRSVFFMLFSLSRIFYLSLQLTLDKNLFLFIFVSDRYSEPSQTFRWRFLRKQLIAKSSSLTANFPKSFILDIWLGFEYTSLSFGVCNNMRSIY